MYSFHGTLYATPSPLGAMPAWPGSAPAQPTARQHRGGSPGGYGWAVSCTKASSACGKGKCHDRTDIRVPTVGRGPDRDQRKDPSTSNRRGHPARLSLRKDPPGRPGGGRRHVLSVPPAARGDSRLNAKPERTTGLVALALAARVLVVAGMRHLQAGVVGHHCRVSDPPSRPRTRHGGGCNRSRPLTGPAYMRAGWHPRGTPTPGFRTPT